MSPLQMFIYWLGVVVACTGGIGIAAAVLWWSADRVLRLWMNASGVYRVACHAREHGLDLRTGKPFRDDETLAH